MALIDYLLDRDRRKDQKKYARDQFGLQQKQYELGVRELEIRTALELARDENEYQAIVRDWELNLEARKRDLQNTLINNNKILQLAAGNLGKRRQEAEEVRRVGRERRRIFLRQAADSMLEAQRDIHNIRRRGVTEEGSARAATGAQGRLVSDVDSILQGIADEIESDVNWRGLQSSREVRNLTDQAELQYLEAAQRAQVIENEAESQYETLQYQTADQERIMRSLYDIAQTPLPDRVIPEISPNAPAANENDGTPNTPGSVDTGTLIYYNDGRGGRDKGGVGFTVDDEGKVRGKFEVDNLKTWTKPPKTSITPAMALVGLPIPIRTGPTTTSGGGQGGLGDLRGSDYGGGTSTGDTGGSHPASL